MYRSVPLAIGLLILLAAQARPMNAAEHEYYEIRTILLGENGDEEAIDAYLENALIPALRRLGTGPVGVLEPARSDETGIQAVFVMIPHKQLSDVDSVRLGLVKDEAYQAAAVEFQSRSHTDPAFARIRTELLKSMECWPLAVVPEGTLSNRERVYELRVYESANERIGDLKVEMFNAGEVPIFLDVKVTPIFIGQCLVGPQMPNLTYLTVFENEAARQQAWIDFRVHPDWQKLSKNPRYAGTVSRIDKYVLQAKSYSQM